MARTIAADLREDDVVEAVCHCERIGPLAGGTDRWHRYDSLAALPDRPLGGWEELVVFTADRVYRRVGVGYGGGRSITPRTPEAVAAGGGDAGGTPATSDD